MCYLHSTMVLLIRIKKYLVDMFDVFTFHYGSTYTVCKPFFHCIHNAFTFHYGSTYTRVNVIKHNIFCIYIPLWFYLYKSTPQRSAQNGTIIYIPLWFYLYLSLKIIVCNNVYLHSTMVLLILLADITINLCGLNLHSTMVLLILHCRSGGQ